MSHDLQKYQRQTTNRLIAGGILLVFVVGLGLIYLIYGPGAAAAGFICLGLGVLPIVLVIIFFKIIDWILKRTRPD